jgi:uncharacterized protein (TIGR03437 family)
MNTITSFRSLFAAARTNGRWAWLATLACTLLLIPGYGQSTVSWDTTGNALLSGAYNYREVLWTDVDGTNTLQSSRLQYGTITFDGSGNFTEATTIVTAGTSTPDHRTSSGVYTIAASGLGYITRSNASGGIVYGMVANGVFVGSSTESGVNSPSAINNLFIAARASATPTTTSFTQIYSAAYMNLPALNKAQIIDAAFSIQPSGNGNLPLTTVTGRIGGNAATTSQTFLGATYSFSNSIGTLNLTGAQPGSTPLTTGTMQFYLSPDGGFLFGGSLTGFDMLVAVRAPISSVQPSSIDGLYYSAAMEIDRDALPTGNGLLDSYFGAFKNVGGTVIGHQRVLNAPDLDPYDYTYSDNFSFASTGVHTDLFGYRNFVTVDGKYRVGVGEGSFLGVNVSLKAPDLSGSGVFLNPVGVVNAASFAPFTVGISPGQVITLFGTNMSVSAAQDSTFPATLGGAQVKINGVIAPAFSVSPGQISVVVPYGLQGNVAEIQVYRAGVASNRVTVFLTQTTPGIFTVPATGVGSAAARHLNGILVDTNNPAQPGEYVEVYLTGLGNVSPALTAGSPAPSAEPLARTVATPDVYIDNTLSQAVFSGLTPFLGGLYQIDVKVPTSTSTGNVLVEISSPGAVNSQVLIPVGGAVLSDAATLSAQAKAEGTADHSRRVRTRPAQGSGSRRNLDPSATLPWSIRWVDQQ